MKSRLGIAGDFVVMLIDQDHFGNLVPAPTFQIQMEVSTQHFILTGHVGTVVHHQNLEKPPMYLKRGGMICVHTICVVDVVGRRILAIIYKFGT